MSDETTDGLQFDQAEFAPGQTGAPSACAVCTNPLAGSYFTINGHPACADCAAGFEARFTGGSGFVRLMKSTLFGLLGGLVGAALYYGVAKIAGYELALIAIATGWLTGKGVSLGNGHRGGRLYQVLAVLLTWAAIAASFVPFIDEAILAEEVVAAEEVPGDASDAEPAAADEESFAQLPAPVRWAVEYPFALILPFVTITESPMGVIILLIGLWTAWGTNKRVQLHVDGPFSLGIPPPIAPGAAESGPADPMPPSA